MGSFTHQEFEARWRKARELMERRGLDGLFITSPKNLTYLTGYRTNLFSSSFRPFTAVIPREGLPSLLLPKLEEALGRETSWCKEIQVWGGPVAKVKDPLVLAQQVFKEKGLDRARVGIEQTLGNRIGMTLSQYDDLRRLLPDVTWMDSGALMWELRMVKSPAEVAMMRRACEITDASLRAAVEASREGVTEFEIQVVMGQTMMSMGAETIRSLSIASGPERYGILNGAATSRKFQRGEMVNIDCGCIYKDYHADLTRGYFIGEVSVRQRAFYQASYDFFHETVAAVRPGMTCHDLDLAAELAIHKSGYKDYMVHRTGHSLGLEVHEMPSIGPGDQTVLAPGMVLAIEPGIYDFSIGAFRIEDNVVVTETGCDLLSNAAREIIVR